MAFGDGPDDAKLSAEWDRFCDRLKAAGALAFKDHNPASSLHRADAFRFLTQNLGQAFDLAYETKDAAFPQIYSFTHATRKLGSDAADFLYQQAWISGEHGYRISGNKGSARFFNLTVQGARPETIPGTDWPSLHEPFGDMPEANLFGEQITAKPDGSFELFLGGPERADNWLPLTPQSRKLFIRQGFDRWDETPWRLHIERLNFESPRPLPLPDDIVRAFGWAGDFVFGLMRDWPDHPYNYSNGAVDPAQPNRFPDPPSADGDSKRGRAVANMVWRLQPDEALVVTFAPIPDSFWMASLGGVFMNSFDYLYRPVSYTPSRATVDADGKVRLVLCSGDPGYANWLDACGFEQGNLAIRTLRSAVGPEIETLLVKSADLSAVLPTESTKVTSGQRQELMLERFRAIHRQRMGV